MDSRIDFWTGKVLLIVCRSALQYLLLHHKSHMTGLPVKTPIKKSVLTSLDLFSGAGGMAEGFRQAGYRAVFATDFDEMAGRTFSWNHPEVPFETRDIRNLSVDEILDRAGAKPGDVDVVCGGPPCQMFSLAGPRIAEDPRNRLFLEFVRIVRGVSPKSFVFENVPGLMSMKGGSVLMAILREFASAGYRCAHKVVNAADYGVPQARPRLIIIGMREMEPIDFPRPTHAAAQEAADLFAKNSTLPAYLTVWDALSDLPTVDQGEGAEELGHSGVYHNDYQRGRRGARSPGTIYNHRATGHSPLIQQRYAMIPEGGTNACVPERLRTKKINVFKLERSKPARTVTCNHRTDLLHPVIPRGTTVREAARLQSFDDDYRFFGNLTRKAKFVTQDDQVGNAVPPLLARALAPHLRLALDASMAVRDAAE